MMSLGLQAGQGGTVSKTELGQGAQIRRLNQVRGYRLKDCIFSALENGNMESNTWQFEIKNVPVCMFHINQLCLMYFSNGYKR